MPTVGGPDAVTDGCYINYPDVDLDTEWNLSGQTWAHLYYKGAYPRLLRAKLRWDPHNVLRHAQSIRRLDKKTAK